MLKICWPLNEKSFIEPFNLPQAIMLPAKETEPMISPNTTINKNPFTALAPPADINNTPAIMGSK